MRRAERTKRAGGAVGERSGERVQLGSGYSLSKSPALPIAHPTSRQGQPRREMRRAVRSAGQCKRLPCSFGLLYARIVAETGCCDVGSDARLVRLGAGRAVIDSLVRDRRSSGGLKAAQTRRARWCWDGTGGGRKRTRAECSVPSPSTSRYIKWCSTGVDSPVRVSSRRPFCAQLRDQVQNLHDLHTQYDDVSARTCSTSCSTKF